MTPIQIPRVWFIVFCLVVASILIGVVAIARDQISVKDAEVTKIKREAALDKNRAKNELEETKRGLARSIESLNKLSASAVALGGVTQSFIENQAKIESLRKIQDSQARLKSLNGEESKVTPTVLSAPREMTAEEKLAAYNAGGIEGIPSNISKEIITKANGERHPFSAVSEIEAEANGYFAFQAFSNTTTVMPYAVKNGIVTLAQREHPGDWSRMADEVKEQADAWTTIDQWTRGVIPGLNKGQTNAALAVAAQRYPSDWHSRLYAISSEASKVAK